MKIPPFRHKDYMLHVCISILSYSGCKWSPRVCAIAELNSELQYEGTLQCMSMKIHLTKSRITTAEPRTEAKLT